MLFSVTWKQGNYMDYKHRSNYAIQKKGQKLVPGNVQNTPQSLPQSNLIPPSTRMDIVGYVWAQALCAQASVAKSGILSGFFEAVGILF